jgi:DNA-binding beta-propeller fold protein YncE
MMGCKPHATDSDPWRVPLHPGRYLVDVTDDGRLAYVGIDADDSLSEEDAVPRLLVPALMALRQLLQKRTH